MEPRMTKIDNPFAAFDLNKMLGDLKMPGFDPAAVAAAQQKNIDAITAANKRAIEGYQAIAKRQAEIFQENLKEVASMMKSTPDVNATKQADVMRQAVEKRSDEHTSELQSLMRISYAVLCLKKKTNSLPSTPPMKTITTNYNS